MAILNTNFDVTYSLNSPPKKKKIETLSPCKVVNI